MLCTTMSSGFSPPGMVLSPWHDVISTSVTGLKSGMSSSGTEYSFT